MARVSTILLRPLPFALLLALVLLAVSLPVIAASAPRTFVASYGNGAHPCTLTGQVLALLGTGVAVSAGDNYYAFDASDGPSFTGTGGLK